MGRRRRGRRKRKKTGTECPPYLEPCARTGRGKPTPQKPPVSSGRQLQFIVVSAVIGAGIAQYGVHKRDLSPLPPTPASGYVSMGTHECVHWEEVRKASLPAPPPQEKLVTESSLGQWVASSFGQGHSRWREQKVRSHGPAPQCSCSVFSQEDLGGPHLGTWCKPHLFPT